MQVGDVYHSTRREDATSTPDLRYAWSAYQRVCDGEHVDPIPVTTQKVVALWCSRVIGQGLKSSALKSITSRILTRADLMGQTVDHQVVEEIKDELGRFCTTFPCEVSAAAPPLGASDGRLTRVIEYAEQRSQGSLFFLGITALLRLAAVLYPRSSGLLDGNLRLGHLLFQPPGPSFQGGLVVRLILPKKGKKTVDARFDSHPVPMGPAVTALLSFLRARGLLIPGAPAGAAVFPDIDPVSNEIRSPILSVDRSTSILRQFVFIPSGIEGGELLTLRSIRYGSHTDALMAGVPEPERLAQGGWRSQGGVQPYIDRSVAALLSPRK